VLPASLPSQHEADGNTFVYIDIKQLLKCSNLKFCCQRHSAENEPSTTDEFLMPTRAKNLTNFPLTRYFQNLDYTNMSVRLSGLISELLGNVAFSNNPGACLNSPARVALYVVTFLCGIVETILHIWRFNREVALDKEVVLQGIISEVEKGKNVVNCDC
jgi:hypothetical protein